MTPDQLKFYRYSPTIKPIYQGKFCSVPWDTIQIDEDGDVMLCGCQQHMPYVVGNIYQSSLTEIWKGPIANMVRDSVAAGDFTYCAWSCPHLNILVDRPDRLPDLSTFPLIVKIDLDRSCNLKCPSCRLDVIIEKNGPRIDKQKAVYNEIVSWALAHPKQTVTVIPVASGEIFASHSGLAFLESLRNYPLDNLKVRLTSNGTLIAKNQDLIKQLESVITKWSISLDAATEDTYTRVRGGDWSALLEGLDVIQPWHGDRLQLNFCIQRDNYQEIESFAELANQYGAFIQYQKLMDWGHQSVEWIKSNNVFNRTTQTFDQVLDRLAKVKAQYPIRVTLPPDLARQLEQAKNTP